MTRFSTAVRRMALRLAIPNQEPPAAPRSSGSEAHFLHHGVVSDRACFSPGMTFSIFPHFTRRNTPAPAQESPGTSPDRTSVQGSRGGRHLRQSMAVYTPGPGPVLPLLLKVAARRSDGGMVHSSGPVLRADVSRYSRYRSPGIPGGCRMHPRAAVMVPSGPRRDTS